MFFDCGQHPLKQLYHPFNHPLTKEYTSWFSKTNKNIPYCSKIIPKFYKIAPNIWGSPCK